ncbi:hypothetical protein GCM10020358_36450 [Amorphoplanes nipponensis]
MVAHHMSVISVQARLARYVCAPDPQTAEAALATVPGRRREALDEMRRMLALLRAADDGPAEPPAYAPDAGAARPARP